MTRVRSPRSNLNRRNRKGCTPKSGRSVKRSSGSRYKTVMAPKPAPRDAFADAKPRKSVEPPRYQKKLAGSCDCRAPAARAKTSVPPAPPRRPKIHQGPMDRNRDSSKKQLAGQVKPLRGGVVEHHTAAPRRSSATSCRLHRVTRARIRGPVLEVVALRVRALAYELQELGIKGLSYAAPLSSVRTNSITGPTKNCAPRGPPIIGRGGHQRRASHDDFIRILVFMLQPERWLNIAARLKRQVVPVEEHVDFLGPWSRTARPPAQAKHGCRCGHCAKVAAELKETRFGVDAHARKSSSRGLAPRRRSAAMRDRALGTHRSSW